MKYLNNIKTKQFQLKVWECECGFHIGLDATYLDQINNIYLTCPGCRTITHINNPNPPPVKTNKVSTARHPETLDTAFDQDENMHFDALADEEFNY